MVLLMILAALHLPVLSLLLRKRAGQETAATFFAVYIIINLLLTVVDGLTRGGQLALGERGANDLQAFGAFILSFVALIAILHFVRRNSRNWLIVGGIWLARSSSPWTVSRRSGRGTAGWYSLPGHLWLCASRMTGRASLYFAIA